MAKAEASLLGGEISPCYRVRGVSLLKFPVFDSCLAFSDFDIFPLIKEKNIFGDLLANICFPKLDAF